MQILDIKTETPELIDSLTTLSTFYSDNTPAARRALRSTIEQRGIDINEKFITAAEAVITVWYCCKVVPDEAHNPTSRVHVQVLDRVQGNLDGLSSSCGQISSILSSTKASTSHLLGEMERLQQEYEAADRKSQLVITFLEQYQLTPEEVRNRGLLVFCWFVPCCHTLMNHPSSSDRRAACMQTAALQGEDVSPQFFAALARVRQIHENCR